MIIADASSLILLAKLNMLDNIIKHSKHKLAIPEQVYEECTIKKGSFDAQIIAERVDKKLIEKRSILDKKFCNKLALDFNLGMGEAEAICLCMDLKSGIITDDKKAINACRVLKIEFATVPKILVQFYKNKILAKDEAVLTAGKLKEMGRYSEDIFNKLKEDLK